MCTLGHKGKVGGFQNAGVGLQAFPSFPLPLPPLLLTPFFAGNILNINPMDSRNACYAGKRKVYNVNQRHDLFFNDSSDIKCKTNCTHESANAMLISGSH